jgi:hypothetical protein
MAWQILFKKGEQICVFLKQFAFWWHKYETGSYKMSVPQRSLWSIWDEAQTDNAITSHLENHQHYISNKVLDLQKEDSLTSNRIPPCGHRKQHVFNFWTWRVSTIIKWLHIKCENPGTKYWNVPCSWIKYPSLCKDC